MKPRPPYVTESATEYYNKVIVPYFDKAKIGFHRNSPQADGYCGSYTCYHWYREPGDTKVALIIEKDIRSSK